jgi:hypothetical protein
MDSERNMTTLDNKAFNEQTLYGGGHFPDELPARPALSPGAARWTKLRNFFTVSPSSYNFIHTPNGQARVRRIAMVVIIGLGSALSVLNILSAVINGNVAGIVIYSLLAVLSLWFTATCLAIIGDAAGSRNYSGKWTVSCAYLTNLTLTRAPETLAFRSFLGSLPVGLCGINCRLVLWAQGVALGSRWNWVVARHTRSCSPGRMGAKALLICLDHLIQEPDLSRSSPIWCCTPVWEHYVLSAPSPKLSVVGPDGARR